MVMLSLILSIEFDKYLCVLCLWCLTCVIWYLVYVCIVLYGISR